MNATPLRIGIAGLGRAFTMMLPTFVQDARIKVVAATDPLAQARSRFVSDFGGAVHESVEALCADPQVQLVYIATPHQLHCQHVCVAAAHGKHVLVEKPMAITLDECSQMVQACRAAGVHLIVGHSHSFDAPILRLRAILDSGQYGAVRMITAVNYTDFLYRPRRPEELDTQLGGGVVFSQGAHQVDIVRLLGGGLVRSVRAFTGNWDPARPTEGAYSALLGFEGGAFCSATYSGYAHYDSDRLMGNIGESGARKADADYGAARRRLVHAQTAEQEATLKAARNYGGVLYAPPSLDGDLLHPHFGHMVVSCDKADLHPTPSGILIFTDSAIHVEALPRPRVPRSAVLDELIDSVVTGKPALHNGEWARATTEVCLAILDSARSGAERSLLHQVAPGHNYPSAE